MTYQDNETTGPDGAQAAAVIDAPDLDDAHIGPHIAEHYLQDEFVWTGRAFGWMRYDGRRWERVDESPVAEAIRLGVLDLHNQAVLGGAPAPYVQAISKLFGAHRMRSILYVARNHLWRAAVEFDAHPDLLNVRNGIIDLHDGKLRPHDRDLRLTRIAMTDYDEDAVHDDWDKALTAVTKEVADWLQVRMGQGLTGYQAPDDVMVVLHGSGENGKTTIVDGVREALAPDHAVTLPDRVLLARTGDHPTELMTLRDARLALMEEFPELGHINVKRLKDLHGTGEMSARHCGKDTVYWTPSHTIFVTTNYLPRVDESDHGTWRRLAMVGFPYRYRKPHEAIERPGDLRGDEGLRQRVRDGREGQHEAVLAWLVKGAMRWYQDSRRMPEHPEAVKESTQAWRGSSDLLLRYIKDRLVFDVDAHVMSADLYEDFAAWLREHGHLVWTDQNFSARFSQHQQVVDHTAKKGRAKATRKGLSRRPSTLFANTSYERIPKQYTAWFGIRFRTDDDTQETSDDLDE